MSSSSARRRRGGRPAPGRGSGAGHILWGRIGVAVVALLAAFGLGRCSADEGVALADHQAAQARISELEQLTRDLEQNQLAVAAGGIDSTPAPAPAPQPAPQPLPTPQREPTPPPATEAPPPPAPSPSPAGSEYTVKEGDTLEAIAEQAYGDRYAYPRIKEANGLEGNELHIGQVLLIPPPPPEGA
jgi:nucleoid-associated protein YgaU